MARLTTLMRIAIFVIVGVLSASTIALGTEDNTFYETFNTNWKGRWFITKTSEYKGRWKYEKSQGHDDYGLVVGEKAKKYGISYNLPFVIDPNKKALTLQYEVRFQNGIHCGGAYLKYLLPKVDENESNEINNNVPYSIMFGADKCGSTNKAHFIFRHKNPISEEFVEHHMIHPALVEVDKFTHVYTATIYPDINTVRIFVDGDLAKICDFTKPDFEPLLIPPLMIADPADEKPKTWDERQKIPDPNATKPIDWNENEPRQLADVAAKKPKGWLEDEPEEKDKPDSTKPANWNDVKDGEWEKETIHNPKCGNAPGCGPWKPPMKDNPLYRGKWTPPLINNPNYNGKWKPKLIPNPNYYYYERPQFEKIGRIGIEIWTMDDGIVFDNILITHNESFASEVRNQTWRKKIQIEKQIEEGESDKTLLKKILRSPFLIKLAVKRLEKNALIVGLLGTIPVFLISLYLLKYDKRHISKFGLRPTIN